MPKTADVRALGELAASRYGVVTIVQAAALNISSSVLDRLCRDGTLIRCRPGVLRFSAHPATWKQSLYAATIEQRAFASRLSALAVHRIDGFTDPPITPQLTCHHGSPVRMLGADIHRTRSLPRCDVTIVDGIACTTLARTVIDVAPIVGPMGLMRMLDDLQRRRVSLQWVLQRAVELAKPGRSGPAEVAEAVRRRLGGYRPPDSWFERLLASSLRSPILHGIVEQYELRGTDDLVIARFDLAVPAVRLGIEGHSRSFHLGEEAERYDEDRDTRVVKLGWDIHYLGFGATRSTERARHDLEEVVVRRAKDLGLPVPGNQPLRLLA